MSTRDFSIFLRCTQRWQLAMVWRWSLRHLQRIEWTDCDSVLADLRHDSIENVGRPCHRRRLADPFIESADDLATDSVLDNRMACWA
jgi:hypothetical protein